MARVQHVWDMAGRIPLKRSSYRGMQLENLEPGVKYFVFQLERLGLLTFFSCEGHPNGFYISFMAPEVVARFIASIGPQINNYTIELPEDRRMKNVWIMRMSARNERDRRWRLRNIADRWESALGSLNVDGLKALPSDAPLDPDQTAAEKLKAALGADSR